MRINFFEDNKDQTHLFSVGECDVPSVGDIVWTNAVGRDFEGNKLRGHIKWIVTRRDFSIMLGGVASNGEPFVNTARCEVFLKKES